MEAVVTTGATRRAKLQSNRHHQQSNIQFFYRPDAFLSPKQQCQSTDRISSLTCLLTYLLTYLHAGDADCVCCVSASIVVECLRRMPPTTVT